MSGRRAVILDMGASGPRSREGGALQSALSSRGFVVERFNDERGLLDALAREPADVLVVDADSPSLDLRELVESLRNDPRTALTLIVALASGDPRELPARREIALALSKPINPDEAASRLEGLVVTRQRASANQRELRGDLAQLPLPDLLQLLAVSRASGSLAIDAAGRRGALLLDSGEVRDVSCGPATGLKAFVRLLMLNEGAFVFTHGAVEPAAPGTEVLALGPTLFEATRQVDEIARLKPLLPDPWTEVRRNRQPLDEELQKRVESEMAFAEVERLLRTPRTLGALLDASPATDADLLVAFDAFRRAGFVDIAGGSGGDRVEVLDPPYAAALVARLAEGGRVPARVLMVVDPSTSSAGSPIVRALGGIAGFVPAEGALLGSWPLGTLGTLMISDARIELYAVPAERDLYPLWAVVGASADAAIIAADSHDAGREERVLSAEIGLPVVRVNGTPTARSVADALRNAFERLIPRR